jgi:RNA polymerase sigma factor (sigma-70 family)
MADKPARENPIRIEDHMGLLRSCVLKFVKSGPVEDSELYSVGCLALVEASRTFDPSKSKFSTWATLIVTQRLVDELRRGSRIKESPSTDLDSRPEEDRESLPLHLLPDLLGGEGDERSMVVGHYLEGRSLSDLGREFGYSKEWIRKKIQSAVSKMRRENLAVLDAYL